MRIGLFTDTFPPEINGVANSTYILFQGLKKQGHDVFVVTTFAGVGRAKWDENHEILRLAGVELPFLYGYVMTAPFHNNALKIIRSLQLDVIHAQTEFGVGIFARICSKQLGIPLVSTYHTTYEDYTHYVNFVHAKSIDDLAKKGVAKLSQIYGDSSQEVIVPSEKTKELLEKYKVHKDISVIPTGLDLEQFHPTKHTIIERKQIRKEFGFEDNDKVIIYVGRLAKEKSLDIILRAFALLKPKNLPIKLLVVGGGPEFDRLVKMNQELNNANNVKFAGPIPSVAISDFYNAADAFVSASQTETQGMTFIEAMASGLPLFARKDEVLKDLIVENETGYYFLDEEDLAKRLEEFFYIDTDTMNKIHENCLNRVHNYGSDKFCDDILKLYQRVVDEYEEEYFIQDVNFRSDYVVLHIEKDNEDERLKVSIEDYYMHDLKPNKTLTKHLYNILMKEQYINQGYHQALRKLSVKDRSKKEIVDWLRLKKIYSEEVIDIILEKLESFGFIDDNRFCEEEIMRLKLSKKGTNKIIHDLKLKGFNEQFIKDKLDNYEDEEVNAYESAKKMKESAKGTSVYKLKTKIKSKLLRQGYDYSVIERAISQLDFSEESSKQVENVKKYIEKAHRRYEKKYNSNELKSKIYQYCLQQGFESDDIQRALEEVNYDKDN